ncbi:unnamed protein product [Calypogeia fissa]
MEALEDLCATISWAGNPAECGDVNTSQRSAGNTCQPTDNGKKRRGRPPGRKAAVATNQAPGAEGFPAGPKKARARKSRVAPPFPLEKVFAEATKERSLVYLAAKLDVIFRERFKEISVNSVTPRWILCWCLCCYRGFWKLIAGRSIGLVQLVAVFVPTGDWKSGGAERRERRN